MTPDTSSFGAMLDSVMKALPKGTNVTQKDGALIILASDFTTRLDITAFPAGDASDFTPQIGPIKAVVQVRSELPPVFVSPGYKYANKFATVGALTVEAGKAFVGSRITLFEHDDDAWNAWFPVVVYAVAFGLPSMIGALNPNPKGRDKHAKSSSWTASDFQRVEKALSDSSTCRISAAGLKVEFGLRSGAATPIQWDAAALLQLSTDESHPLIGHGLVCLLQMPHLVSPEERLNKILDTLNEREMTPDNPAPHFGAWCQGQLERRSNPAYVTVLPNRLHNDRIAATLATAMRTRALWANDILASLGVRELESPRQIGAVKLPDSIGSAKVLDSYELGIHDDGGQRWILLLDQGTPITPYIVAWAFPQTIARGEWMLSSSFGSLEVAKAEFSRRVAAAKKGNFL